MRYVLKAMPVIAAAFLLAVVFAPQRARAEERLSMQEMAKRAEAMIQEMRKVRDGAETALRKAKADKALDRIDCINEALIALKGVLRLAEDYQYDLQADLRQGDAKAVEAAYKKVAVAKKKVEDLDSRLKSCGGPTDDGLTDGKPSIDKILDPDLPNEDPLEALERNNVFILHPPGGSPYQ